MKWEDYYDRFWDWAESTKISRISSLTDFSSSAEVVEIANEFFDEKIGSRLVKRALDQGIRFSPSEIIELGSCVTDDLFCEVIQNRQGRFTAEQYEELEGLCCDEDLLEAVARRDGIRREMDDLPFQPQIAVAQPVKKGNRSINPRYRKVVVPGIHTAENHDFISSDQGSRSSISKSLLCSARSGNMLSR